eukprot:TRINITY_DN4028_c0_g1_i1.p1 TRINITY_DN4028_c0_g1~~TRINITY_DN4028_c0_g1_i1.p1  ORF type:complete len:742 (+),score=148.88 TRINITY_DN4028_c0_g1_i1:82-2307(+)
MEDSELQLRPKICQAFTDINTFYTISSPKPVGEGQNSSVYRATCNETDEEVAIKVTKKVKRGIEHAVRKEIDALKRVTHQGIMRYIAIREDEQKFYTILEWIHGDSLQKVITDGGSFSEPETVLVMRSLLKAVAKLHQQKIIHRDLKLANLMFSLPGRRGLKIIDFGLAEFIVKDVDINKPCGTQKYMPPEMFSKRDYKTEVDMWSVGVICFILLTGCDPFPGRGSELVNKIQEGVFHFPSASGLSKESQSFVKKLLTKQDKRLSAEQALQHPWLVKPSDRYSQFDLRFNGSYKTLRDSLKLKRCSWKGAIWCVRIGIRILKLCKKVRKVSLKHEAVRNGKITPRGKRYASNDIALCNHCNQPITDTTDGLEVLGGYIHASCFKCGICSAAITDGRYVEFDSLACHRKCVEAAKSNQLTCQKCSKPIGKGSYLTIEGANLHVNCFKCYVCDKKLEGSYAVDDCNRPCHSECVDAVRVSQSKRRCKKCGQFIDEVVGYVDSESESYHPECYKSVIPTCKSCSKPLEGRYVEVSGERFHKNCFTCGICCSILSDKFVKYNNKYCHEACVKKRRSSSSSSSSSSCNTCGKKLLGGVSFEGKRYHDKCFTCSHCQLVISDKASCHRGEPFHKRCLDKQLLRRGSSFASQGGGEKAVRSPGARRVSISEASAFEVTPSPPPYSEREQNPPSPTRRPKEVAVEQKQPQQPCEPQVPKSTMSAFCHECGNKHVIVEAKFCMSCGTKRI